MNFPNKAEKLCSATLLILSALFSARFISLNLLVHFIYFFPIQYHSLADIFINEKSSSFSSSGVYGEWQLVVTPSSGVLLGSLNLELANLVRWRACENLEIEATVSLRHIAFNNVIFLYFSPTSISCEWFDSGAYSCAATSDDVADADDGSISDIKNVFAAIFSTKVVGTAQFYDSSVTVTFRIGNELKIKYLFTFLPS